MKPGIPSSGAGGSADASPSSALRGLPAEESERSAANVFERIPWEGLPPDPDALSAREFLALL